MAVLAGARGAHAIGAAPLAGYSPRVIVPPVVVSGIASFAFNDRYEIVLAAQSGVGDTVPEFRFWSVQPPDWSAVLPAGDRARLIPFYALDEDRRPVHGAVEFPYVKLPKTGDEFTVSYVQIEFVCRPATLGTFDGGVDNDEPCGFDVYVEGFGQAGIAAYDSDGVHKTGVVRSDLHSFRIAAGDVGAENWPNYMTAVLPCRIATHVREARVSIPDVFHCQIVAAELWGEPQPGRST